MIETREEATRKLTELLDNLAYIQELDEHVCTELCCSYHEEEIYNRISQQYADLPVLKNLYVFSIIFDMGFSKFTFITEFGEITIEKEYPILRGIDLDILFQYCNRR